MAKVVRVMVTFEHEGKRYDEVRFINHAEWKSQVYRYNIELFKVHEMINNMFKIIDGLEEK